MAKLAIVSVSGGKDSTATALLAIDEHGVENCHFVFCDTGNEHELTYEYVNTYLPAVLGPIVTLRANFDERIANKRKYIEEHWPKKGVPAEAVARALAVIQPTGNPYLDLCLWKGRFPSRKVQFCTHELKRYPLDDYHLARMIEGYEVESWRGIRRDESQNRRNAQPRERVVEGWTVVHPIVDWTAQQTVDFVRSRALKLNPLYSQGMARVGCMPCINCSKGELREIASRFPRHIDRIRQWEELMCQAAKRGWTTFFADSAEEGETDEQIYNRLRIDSRVAWSKTAWGGKQLDLTKMAVGPSCSSVYGLCE
jgi:3'-phosphoadenosine 5'-phosphosulfate sulfotransferase (PAPS reductase)/FAD synthetase